MTWWAPGLALGLCLLANACSQGGRSEAALAELVPGLSPEVEVHGVFHERGGPGRLRYLGLSHDAGAQAGAPFGLEHLFEVEVPFVEDAQVFVHLENGSQGRVAVDDHVPIGGRVPLSSMRAGERWRDRHTVELPLSAKSGTLSAYFGLFRGSLRMTLETEPGRNDGRDRLLIARVPLAGAPDPRLPVATVARAANPVVPDGVLSEPDWARAEVLELADTLGRSRSPRFPTKLRLLYDETYLYVGFEVEDHDISERYSERDDPIYEHETVELFLMPGVKAPELGPYVELQASPTGVIFDASFLGRRKGMNTGYQAGQTVGTKRSGTLNDDEPDEGWVSEWRVPFAGIRGANGAPKPGDEWRMNAFRIEKYRSGPKGEFAGEYTGWSPPMVGDFHAVDRFGRLVFGGAAKP